MGAFDRIGFGMISSKETGRMMMRILKNYPYIPYGMELTEKRTDARRTAQQWDFVAFTAKTVPELGQSLRFYGGTAATGITPCAPTMTFDIFGNCEVVIGEWMNEQNCPNAFDKSFLCKLTRFVQENLPILSLLYLGYLSCADAMDYFTGRDKWEIMLTGIKNVPDDTYLWLQYAEDPFDLHKRAFDAGLYQTLSPELVAEAFLEEICPALKSISKERFEVDIWSDEWYLNKYNGSAPWVTVPEDYAVIGDEAFMGHGELRQVRLLEGCFGIAPRAFAGCANLIEINIPESCDWIGKQAFAECTSLKSLVLPPRAWLEEGAFQYCTALQTIEIPEGVEMTEANIFLGCGNLVIRCKENSCAHRYAQEHGIRFELQV